MLRTYDIGALAKGELIFISKIRLEEVETPVGVPMKQTSL